MHNHCPNVWSYFYPFLLYRDNNGKNRRYYICKKCKNKIVLSTSLTKWIEVANWIAYCLFFSSIAPIEKMFMRLLGLQKLNLKVFLIMIAYCLVVHLFYQALKYPFLTFDAIPIDIQNSLSSNDQHLK